MSSQPARGYLVIAAAIVIAGVLISASLLVVFTRPPQTTTTTETTTSTITSTMILPCDLPVWNSSQTPSNEIPVLLMQPGSTAYVCVTYQSAWQGNQTLYNNETLNSSLFTNGTYQFGLYIIKAHCVVNATEFGCDSSVSHSFTISATPGSIRPLATTSYVTVVYVVDALSNSTGFYDGSAPFEYCYALPMAVGYPASQVNASDFAPRMIHSCAFSPFTPSAVSVGGMSVTHLTFPTL